jgi:hypothetical protein
MTVQDSLQVPSERYFALTVLIFTESEEDNMRKFGYIVAALGAIAVAVPSIASAETVVIKRGGHHHDWNRSRAEVRVHRDWHPGWHRGWHHDRDRVVIRDHRY